MNAIALKGLLCAAVLAVPLMASAESNFQTGAATATRLPTQVAARIAFLNAFIPSSPLSS